MQALGQEGHVDDVLGLRGAVAELAKEDLAGDEFVALWVVHVCSVLEALLLRPNPEDRSSGFGRETRSCVLIATERFWNDQQLLGREGVLGEGGQARFVGKEA